ncbi:protein kinase domain-containing protein [Calothrix sp. PCC 6303]|uniref:protein kinase domain-containing protein n=1 Tax=Calothrix sp. PCC 6303 TaxID=1170562 RepID=UPI0002A01DE2|nr:ATP-binding protein [Calothrix sp. PCC 6303]AFZ01941.1 multi-sensor signal transduction multi-kinase [Calothrix sp. PCC 6303]
MALFASINPNSLPEMPGYTILEELYVGSRTAVYRAVQNAQQCSVVIKVVRRDYPSFEELVQFRNQYTITKHLPIHGIVRPLSLEPLGNGYVLVMEDCGGVSLGKYIQQQSLDMTDVLTIALQIADILHDLWHHQVVHKDIKPTNILIHPESKQVKLIDFSIASLLPKETREIQCPQGLEGTLAYLAPEQTGQMNRGIDYRADFYGLGVTLYQLLTGILPFTSDDPLELIHCHIAKVPVPINYVKADVPPMVAAIVTKLMAKNAEDRYQSALGLKHDLEQCLTQWKKLGKIAAFELGLNDLSDRLPIPQQSYSPVAKVQDLAHGYPQSFLQQQIQASQQFLKSLIDNIPQIVIWKDRNSTFLGCNTNAAKILNLESPDQIVGKTDYDFSFTPEEIEWYQECDRRIMESGQAELNIVETQQKPDGSQSWLSTSKIPLRDSNSNVIGILITIEDITHRKVAEAIILKKSQELEEAAQALQNTQLQMVQGEKMASLGNLVAGVAHEINNPIGFLNGSINNTKEYIQYLLEHIALYQQHHPNAANPVEKHAEDIDLKYLSEDLPKLLDSMQRATDRITDISTSLRTFSRADNDHKVSADLHEGIDSTLLILKYRIKANDYRPAIQVIQNYGDLPKIKCLPGQLNQVFMNILANAIDAFDETAQQSSLADLKVNPQKITIKTTLTEQGAVEIYIRDNGKGMPEEVKSRIFDHLFTTKGVDKGTGLGLAIARQIVVEKHGGSLEVKSQLGQGTEFYIRLPA